MQLGHPLVIIRLGNLVVGLERQVHRARRGHQTLIVARAGIGHVHGTVAHALSLLERAA